MVTNMVIFLTVLVYGVNFLVYMYLKINHIKDYLEKISYLFWNEYDSVVHEWHLFVFGK